MVSQAARLGEFIARKKDVIVARWAERVVALLSLAENPPQLIDDLPVFIDDMVKSLESNDENVCYRGGARAHGRQRKEIGMDIGALAIEFSLVGETVLELAETDGFVPTLAEIRALFRVTALGTEESVTAYAALRDREIENQAARHYSFIAHELRAPLQSACLAASLLTESRGNRGLQLDTLTRALMAVTSLVDDSLLGARLQGQPAPRYERLRSPDLLREVTGACHLAAERRGVRVQVRSSEFELDVDRKIVTSLLTNLVGNAVKFTPAGGRVQVLGSVVEGRAHFEIADRCGGMPEDLPGRLFHPHVQEGGDRSGFGLGLSIVKLAVDAHAGTIRVVNEPGVGCRFVVDLPLQKPEDL
jgi:signal transduction histidine kinase